MSNPIIETRYAFSRRVASGETLPCDIIVQRWMEKRMVPGVLLARGVRSLCYQLGIKRACLSALDVFSKAVS